MEFTIKNLDKSVNDIMRQIGYQPAYFQNEGEISLVKPLAGNPYPRFHVYIKPIRQAQGEQNGQDFQFALRSEKSFV